QTLLMRWEAAEVIRRGLGLYPDGGERRPLCNSAEPALGYESEELERCALRVLFPSFPLADEARRHIQITGEDSLTGPLPQPERADFPGFQRPHRRKAQVIEFAHTALVHYAGRVKTFGGLMDRSH